MFRPTASRAILRTLTPAQSSRLKYSAALGINKNVTLFRALAHRRPQAIQSLIRPTTTTLFYATKSEPKKSDATGVMKKKLEHHPETVSGHSSVRHIMSEEGGGNKSQHEEDMMAGIKQDIVTIKDTFALTTVPKESYYIGAAGILPYAATALSTAYLAFDVNHAAQHGMGYLFSPELASQLLEIITPLQIGYGAVIISFLGAIHWGLEYAGYGGYHSYRRYMYGVIAPAVAWPTIFMPVETALITQFLAFVFLYFADARATVAGWFPPWYSSYRFVLTFFVGASIVVTLIGRGQIARHDVAALKSPIESIKKDKDMQWEALEKEEIEKQKRIAEEEEEEEGEEGEEGEEEEGGEENDGEKAGKDKDEE